MTHTSYNRNQGGLSRAAGAQSLSVSIHAGHWPQEWRDAASLRSEKKSGSWVISPQGSAKERSGKNALPQRCLRPGVQFFPWCVSLLPVSLPVLDLSVSEDRRWLQMYLRQLLRRFSQLV